MKEYKIEVLSRGGCIDQEGGSIYQIDTYSLRLSPEALNDYIHSGATEGNWEDDFDSYEAYAAQIEAKIKTRDQWKLDIARAIGLTGAPGKIALKQIMSEFFAVVHIQKIEMPKT